MRPPVAGAKYVVWILAAPLLAKIPIPLVSTLIAVSPLSIKFLLGSQLHSATVRRGDGHSLMSALARHTATAGATTVASRRIGWRFQ